MSKTQIVLLVLTILLFSLGLWPIALLTAVGLIAIALHKKEETQKADKKKIEELERQIEIERMVKNSDRGTKHE